MKHIAIIWFPGTNCEEETLHAVEAAGMSGTIVRWNQKLNNFDGYIIPGGWSYEDRIRAGAIAAHDIMLEQIKKEAALGKPVLGICNGCQVITEAGLVPHNTSEPEIALAPNKNPFVSGYFCTHTFVKIKKKTAFTLFNEGDILKIPIAHGEGRFITSDERIKEHIKEYAAVVYCTAEGEEKQEFPINPNGSLHNIAGLTNDKGNVLALMPHPERCAFDHQTGARANNGTPGIKIFQSMKRYIENANTLC
ncbi:MAG TPA: phosphoribosylformylglycinamidine synthase I [Candidatus Nanoarchaeia archaeon]|nr:phosphoribosylformylglycinamidine synthase I [Candidatus Nanoarchaeia archaeon]